MFFLLSISIWSWSSMCLSQIPNQWAIRTFLMCRLRSIIISPILGLHALGLNMNLTHRPKLGAGTLFWPLSPVWSNHLLPLVNGQANRLVQDLFSFFFLGRIVQYLKIIFLEQSKPSIAGNWRMTSWDPHGHTARWVLDLPVCFNSQVLTDIWCFRWRPFGCRSFLLVSMQQPWESPVERHEAASNIYFFLYKHISKDLST